MQRNYTKRIGVRKSDKDLFFLVPAECEEELRMLGYEVVTANRANRYNKAHFLRLNRYRCTRAITKMPGRTPAKQRPDGKPEPGFTFPRLQDDRK